MSIGSLGVIGGLSASPLTQKTADTDRAQQSSVQQQRQADAAQKAENAAGIAETDSEAEAGDRDADGRRLWELAAKKKEEVTADPEQPPEEPPRSIDLSGASGGQLDLT